MPEDRPGKRATTHGGDGRHQRRSPTAGAPIAYIEDDVTGRYSGNELEEKRRERDARTRAQVEAQGAAIEVLRKDLRVNETLVNQHNATIKITVEPLIKDLPDKLATLSASLTTMARDIDGVANSMRDHVASISLQLQDQNVRLGGVEAAQQADRARIATVENTLGEHRAEIVKLKQQKRLRSNEVVDAKVGGFIRRHGMKLLLTFAAALATAIAGGIGGYLATKYGVKP